ncbi:hypothetical protein [Sediminibacillus albus]|uniref:Uncharacterized protein n=1 Tax=Sediminibacillus albus TaxID=407036 RepID=A0A1G8WMX1_9BACI|nr:hypothetical protein [Sediminibacillus albus]SDJ79712.1 hypothetical protein SAMN05216243_0900 [Sediminibacillus albus]
MFFKVSDMENLWVFAQELKESNAIGLILIEDERHRNKQKGLPKSTKVFLQTNIVSVLYESHEKLYYIDEKKNNMDIIHKMEKLFRVCHVKEIIIDDQERIGSVFFTKG